MGEFDFIEGLKIKHYKGGIYSVIGIGTDSETGEEVGVYRNDIDNRIWVRPIDMFYETVRYKGDWVPRFIVCEGDSQ